MVVVDEAIYYDVYSTIIIMADALLCQIHCTVYIYIYINSTY